MQPKTLVLATKERVISCDGMLMGYSEAKNSPYIKVFENWVNRIVLGYPLRYREIELPIRNDRQLETMSKLFKFQDKDVRTMASRDFYLNRNKMGSGKTVEMIATCILLDAASVLVCCPKTVQTQWVAQFKKWWPERAEDVRAFEFGYKPKRGDILLVNPEKLISRKAVGLFDKFVWDVFAIDEAHMIKNRSAQRSRACKSIPAQHRYALTGTPVLKTPDDLYSIFEFLNPDIAGSSYWRFAEYSCNIVEDFYGRHVAGLTKDPRKIAILQTILEHVSCYTDTSCAGVKEVIHVPLTMDKKQERLYKQIAKVALEELPPNITIPNGAVKMARLLQTTSCPKVFYDQRHGKETDYSVGIKFEYILDMLQHNQDLKIVVYSKYAQVINQLHNYLENHYINVATYTGQQNEGLRENEKRYFIETPTCRVLAGTIDALGTGVDGLQEACHVCVFIDRDPRPTINEQCEARLFRTGQKETVLCYYLECEKTIDTHMDKLTAIRSEDLRVLLQEDL
jgi:SNF2 family DNA or RNA helicase